MSSILARDDHSSDEKDDTRVYTNAVPLRAGQPTGNRVGVDRAAALSEFSMRENGPMAEVTLRGGIGARVDSEIEAKRSRFLCRLVRVDDVAAADAVIEEAGRDHPHAGHHCWAYVLGPASSPGQLRRSHDDGEPSGTAGRPILNALGGREFVDCIAVVTRYFGGTLLGAGGLARAYSDAAISAMDEATAIGRVVLRVRRRRFSLSLAHSDAGRIEAELRQHGVTILGTDYGQTAVLHLASQDGDSLAALVASATSGVGTVEPAGDDWVDIEPR